MNIRLGLCSAYSLLYGVNMPGKLLDRAISLGAGTVSICDINNLYGVHNFLEEAKEKKIKPVIGTALTRNEKRVYCFVEDKNGFARLCEILTERSKDKDNFNPLKFLREDSSGLVLASANYEILSELSGRVKKLYAAITADSLEGIEAHKKMSLPLAFLDTSLFLEKDDYFVHKVLRAIGLNKTTGSLAPCDTVKSGEGLLKSEKELTSILYSWPEAARGSAEIAAACGFNELFNSFIFPSYGENPFMELRRRVFPGAVERYGELGDTEIDRIEYELDIIEKTGFSAYFLRMDDIVKMAGTGNTRNICGRGSGAASIVSYALGITNVDPIAHNLYFERFLNPARPDPPDIDVDFAWDERDELIKAVIERFGSNYCARVANHNFFKQRSALRETAKAFGFSDGEISGMEKKLETGEVESGIKDEKLWKDILNMAKRIEGLPRGLSMHCGGLVITPEPVCRYAPVEKSLEGFPLLAWEKEGTEARGFVKIDLLGNRSLAVIRDALIRLEEEGIIIDRPWRPEEDEPTIGALASGDSIGVFYIESPAMRQLQKKTGAGDFEHIVIHSSLIRPAANKFISEYVRRLKGGKWEPLHPHLESILDETYGILCYQEDVSKTAVALAGFNEAEADKLRKIIAKKAGAAKLAVYRERFAEGCKKNKVDENTIGKVWAMMLSFDGYSFCKPHSASYAMVSFQSAYLRVHYPAEFMAAVISNQGGYYRPGAYISECRRMGLLLEGPDINKSRWKYFGTSRAGAGNGFFKGTIIIGLMAIKGLSRSGTEEIIKERERGGDFLSLENFSRRIKTSRDDIIALCPAGVFDSIAKGLSRPMQARRLLSMGNNKTERGNEELFEAGFSFQNRSSKIISAHGQALINRLSITPNLLVEEYGALGFLRNLHPLALFKDKIALIKTIKALDMAKFIGRYVKLLGWPITQKEVWTKDGLTMSFFSLEDETAMYETVIFPDIYDRYNRLLFDQRPLIVSGLVLDDQGAITLEVKKIELLK